MSGEIPDHESGPVYSSEQIECERGIKVGPEDPSLIYQLLEKGYEGDLCFELLTSPVNNVTIKSIPNREGVNLQGIIAASDKRKDLDTEAVCLAVGEQFSRYNQDGQVKEKGGSVFVTTASGREFVVSPSAGHGVLVSTGYVKRSDRVLQLLPTPNLNDEHVETVVDDFSQVLQAAIEGVYTQAGQAPPDEELKISLPSEVDTSMELSEAELAVLQEIELTERPCVAAEDIGGQQKAKEELELLAFKLAHPEIARRQGVAQKGGVILHGPTGTGKTTLIKYFAGLADRPVLVVKCDDIVQKWYGEPAKKVGLIFSIARKKGAVLLFDEFDSVASNRDESFEGTQQVVNAILTNMDGIKPDSGVTVVASTNRLDTIDPAIIRPGRFSKQIEVGLPETAEDREVILKIHMGAARRLAGDELFDDVDTMAIAENTHRFSGAELEGVVQFALEEKLKQVMRGRVNLEEKVTTEDLLDAVTEMSRKRKVRLMGYHTIQEVQKQRAGAAA